MKQKEKWAMELNWPSGTHVSDIWLAGFDFAKEQILAGLMSKPLSEIHRLLEMGESEIKDAGVKNDT